MCSKHSPWHRIDRYFSRPSSELFLCGPTSNCQEQSRLHGPCRVDRSWLQNSRSNATPSRSLDRSCFFLLFFFCFGSTVRIMDFPDLRAAWRIIGAELSFPVLCTYIYIYICKSGIAAARIKSKFAHTNSNTCTSNEIVTSRSDTGPFWKRIGI